LYSTEPHTDDSGLPLERPLVGEYGDSRCALQNSSGTHIALWGENSVFYVNLWRYI